MQSTENPVIAVLPYAMRYAEDLASVSISNLLNPLEREIPDDLKLVSDLREVDHLIVYCCWKSLSRDYSKLKCKVSLLVSEPPAVQARYYFLIPLFAKKFYAVLTFSDQLIRRIRNGIFHPGASCWVDPIQDSKKEKLVSIIASRKTKTLGQKLRHEVIESCSRLGVEIELFGRGYREVERKEEALAPFMFSVCIENSSERNYFTEKIVDCFAQKVVPIYWGAPNIAEFFDAEGIIVCKSAQEIVFAIQSASAEEYLQKIAVIEKNHKISLEYKSQDYMAAIKIFKHRDYKTSQ